MDPQQPSSDLKAFLDGPRLARRAMLRRSLAILGVAAALLIINFVRGRTALLTELQSRGYARGADLHVRGLFSWSFAGKKTRAACTGHFRHVFLSASIKESCVGWDPAGPNVVTQEVLEKELKTKLEPLGVDTVRCDAVSAGTKLARCMVWGKSGNPVEMLMELMGERWTMAKPERLASRELLARDVALSVSERKKTPVTVDCGNGLIGYRSGDTLTCSGSRGGSQRPGRVVVTFANDLFDWEMSDR